VAEGDQPEKLCACSMRSKKLIISKGNKTNYDGPSSKNLRK
jgi:hypothetical protein